jgi:hypothetical protein
MKLSWDGVHKRGVCTANISVKWGTMSVGNMRQEWKLDERRGAMLVGVLAWHILAWRIIVIRIHDQAAGTGEQSEGSGQWLLGKMVYMNSLLVRVCNALNDL